MNKQYTDIAYIRRYVNGELSPREMFELEHAAQQDEMLMDIIMGMEFELSHHLSDNIEEIHRRIKERISQSSPAHPVKFFPWAKWSIAASVLLAIGITAYIFLSQQDQDNSGTIAYQPQGESKIENQVIVPKSEEDVTENTPQTESDIQKERGLNKPFPNKETAHIETDNTEQRIAASSSDLSILSKDNSRKLDLAAVDTHKPDKLEEIRLVEIAADDTTNPTVEDISLSYKAPKKDSLGRADIAMVQNLKSQHAQAKVEQKIHTNSPERVRAKLNNMNIDPQTSMMLNQVLSQQAQEQTEVSELAENKRKDIDITDHNYTYLANVKSADSNLSKEKKDNSMTESAPAVTFGKVADNQKSKSTASRPVKGWKAFDDYLGQTLSTKGITSGHFQFEFKIDHKGKPEQIQVIYSDNKEVNAILIDILQKGPIWIRGKDAENVRLALKF